MATLLDVLGVPLYHNAPEPPVGMHVRASTQFCFQSECKANTYFVQTVASQSIYLAFFSEKSEKHEFILHHASVASAWKNKGLFNILL